MFARVLRQRPRPRYVISVDIKDSRLPVQRRPAPLRPAIESRKDHRISAYRKWKELSVTTKFPKLLDRPLVNLWSPSAKQIFRKALAREWSRLPRQWLLGCRQLSGHIARRILLIFDRKQRLSSAAIE